MNNIADLVLDGFKGYALICATDAIEHGLVATWALAVVGLAYVQVVAFEDNGLVRVIITDAASLDNGEEAA